MEKLNLWKVDDPEVEWFFDTIKGTATAENKLLTANETRDFGNGCSLKALSNEVLSEATGTYTNSGPSKTEDYKKANIRSNYHLSFQAEVNIKIEIIWTRTIWEKDDDEYETVEYYFESEEEDLFSDDDGPNYDPRNDPYWEEFLEDFES